MYPPSPGTRTVGNQPSSPSRPSADDAGNADDDPLHHSPLSGGEDYPDYPEDESGEEEDP